MPTGGNRKKNMLMKDRREDEQDEEKDSDISVMNPVTLDFHIHTATI